MTTSTDISLTHYGVKGMKWGKITDPRYENPLQMYREEYYKSLGAMMTMKTPHPDGGTKKKVDDAIKKADNKKSSTGSKKTTTPKKSAPAKDAKGSKTDPKKKPKYDVNDLKAVAGESKKKGGKGKGGGKKKSNASKKKRGSSAANKQAIQDAMRTARISQLNAKHLSRARRVYSYAPSTLSTPVSSLTSEENKT